MAPKTRPSYCFAWRRDSTSETGRNDGLLNGEARRGGQDPAAISERLLAVFSNVILPVIIFIGFAGYALTSLVCSGKHTRSPPTDVL